MNILLIKFFGYDFRAIRIDKNSKIEYNPMEINYVSLPTKPIFKFFLNSSKDELTFKHASLSSPTKLFDLNFLRGQNKLKIKSINSFLFEKDGDVNYKIPSDDHMKKLRIPDLIQTAIKAKTNLIDGENQDSYPNLFCLAIEFDGAQIPPATSIVIQCEYYNLISKTFSASTISSDFQLATKVLRLGVYDTSSINDNEMKEILGNMANPFLIKTNNISLTVKDDQSQEILQTNSQIAIIEGFIGKIIEEAEEEAGEIESNELIQETIEEIKEEIEEIGGEIEEVIEEIIEGIEEIEENQESIEEIGEQIEEIQEEIEEGLEEILRSLRKNK